MIYWMLMKRRRGIRTSGIAYTKLPIGLILPAASPGVDEVRNTVVQVWCRVRWMWAVVWGV